MKRIIINMKNYVFADAVEKALRSEGDFSVTLVENPQEVATQCQLMAADLLLMEVTGYSQWELSERIKIRDEVKGKNSDCKVVLLVDENTEKMVAKQLKQAKKDGIIDQFIYASTSASFLVAIMDTL